MNKENLKKWIDALRSGEYKQGNHRLVTKTIVNDPSGCSPPTTESSYCCLGVACEVALKNGVMLSVVSNSKETGLSVNQTFYDETATELPRKVSDWLGLKYFKVQGFQIPLIIMNDQEKRSFEEIANYLEKRYLNVDEPVGKELPVKRDLLPQYTQSYYDMLNDSKKVALQKLNSFMDDLPSPIDKADIAKFILTLPEN